MHIPEPAKMSISAIEERVSLLERQVATLLGRPQTGDRRPTWERALDRLSSNEITSAIDKAAIEYREEDRRRFKEQYDEANGNDS